MTRRFWLLTVILCALAYGAGALITVLVYFGPAGFLDTLRLLWWMARR